MTITELKRALNSGRVRHYDVVITGWELDGEPGDGGPAMGEAQKIKYTFEPENAQDRSALLIDDPVAPWPRRYRRAQIIGAAPGEPARVLVFDNQQILQLTEMPRPYGCDGQPMDP